MGGLARKSTIIKDLKSELPVLRVPDECAYYKEDAGKILLGAFEPNSKPRNLGQTASHIQVDPRIAYFSCHTKRCRAC